MLNKNTNFNKNKTESKLENLKRSFRKMNLRVSHSGGGGQGGGAPFPSCNSFWRRRRGGGGGGAPFPSCNSFWNHPPPHQNRCPPLKNETIPVCKKTTVPLKSKVSFQKMIPKKPPQKSETLINTCVSIIKQHWKKMVEITQEYCC